MTCMRSIWLNELINLKLNSFSDDPTNVSFFLYDYLPLQCQQCGIRFLDTILGKKQLEDHLDLHFRQNHKLSQNPGRGHDRSWFTSVEVSFDIIDDFLFLTHLPGLGPWVIKRCCEQASDAARDVFASESSDYCWGHEARCECRVTICYGTTRWRS